jgi:hypothetical protein
MYARLKIVCGVTVIISAANGTICRTIRIVGRRLMFTIITANALLVWFVWGFVMALGWVLGTWVMEWLLGMVWRGRPPARREL